METADSKSATLPLSDAPFPFRRLANTICFRNYTEDGFFAGLYSLFNINEEVKASEIPVVYLNKINLWRSYFQPSTRGANSSRPRN